MCGIIGVLGNHQAAPIMVEALKRLEYRGYDSAGIATVHGGVLDRRRALGKLVNLNDLLVLDPLAGTSGIGHTRWATHGAATTATAVRIRFAFARIAVSGSKQLRCWHRVQAGERVGSRGGFNRRLPQRHADRSDRCDAGCHGGC